MYSQKTDTRKGILIHNSSSPHLTPQDEGLSPIEKTELEWHTISLLSKAGKKLQALELLEEELRDRIIPASGETWELQGERPF